MVMKKVITGILAAAMLSSAGTALAAGFTDIKGHWAESAITALTEKGVIDGFSEDVFAPDESVSRAQYLKMIMEATGLKPSEYREGECLEAKETDWYAPYLQKALDSGLIPEVLIAGYKEEVKYTVDENGNATESKVIYQGAFNGDLPINREEMAVLTMYVFQYTRTILTNVTVDEKAAVNFKDSDSISEWAEVSVKAASSFGFIEGDDDKNFNPNGTTTRAQAAAVIKKVADKEDSLSKKSSDK